MIMYHSTRGCCPAVSFDQALLQGFAADGGLFMPASVPLLSGENTSIFLRSEWPEVASVVMASLLHGSMAPETTADLVSEALSFPLPMVRVEERLWILDPVPAWLPTHAHLNHAKIHVFQRKVPEGQGGEQEQQDQQGSAETDQQTEGETPKPEEQSERPGEEAEDQPQAERQSASSGSLGQDTGERELKPEDSMAPEAVDEVDQAGDQTTPLWDSNPFIGQPQANLWFGKTDDLWGFGKPAGWGGPWWETPVQAGVPSDPFLMTGFEHKCLHVAHDAGAATFTVEVDVTGTGTWVKHADLAARDPVPVLRAEREHRPEERRVGKECRSQWSPYH